MGIGFKISTRDGLSGSFTEDNTLDLVRLEKAISPNYSQAVIRRYTGKWRGTEEGMEQLEKTVPHQDLRGKQFKIEVTDKDDNKDVFFGYCPNTTEVIFGSTEGVRASDDDMVIFGLEYYLKRTEIETSTVKDSTEKIIQKALSFNMINNAGALVGNKKTGENFFSADIEAAEKWTGLSIVQYLLTQFDVEAGQTYTLGGQHADLAVIEGSFNCEGRTYWDMLNEVISPERGFSFYVGTDTDPYKIFIFTTTSTQIGSSVPANPNTRPVILDTLHEIQNARVELKEDSHFDRIVCKGGRIRGTGTFTFEDHFDKGWTPTEESDYNNASDEERKSDKFEHVYCRFFLKQDWDGDINGENAIPAVNPTDGSLDDSAKQNLYYPQFKFDRNLAILEKGHPKRPFVIMEDEETDQFRLDNPANDKSGASLVVLSGDKPGIQLRCKIPHILGLNSFTGDSETDPIYDYQTLKATLSYTLVESLRVESSGNEPGAFEKTKIINLPQSRLWFITPGTITDLVDQTETTSSASHEEVINDSSMLVKFAEMATAWYGQQKANISWTYKILQVLDRTGFIITDYTVNGQSNSAESVVSRVVYTFDGQFPETQVQTEQKGIDLRSLVKTRRTSSLNSVSEEVLNLRQEVANIPSREEKTVPGDPIPMVVVRISNSISLNEYTGFLQTSPDPETREDTGSEVTIKPIVELSGGLTVDSFYSAFEKDDVYWIANLAVFN